MGSARLKPESLLLSHAKVIDRYLRLNQTPQPSDVMIVLGNNDNRTAHRAAQLFVAGYAPIMVISGSVAPRTKDQSQTEARRYAEIIARLNPNLGPILLEEQAQNTGQNVIFSRSLLAEQGTTPSTVLVVTKPFVERRAYATFAKQWPGLSRILVTSPQYPFAGYFDPVYGDPFDVLLTNLTGEIDRICKYQKLEIGYIIPQLVPPSVDQARQGIAGLLAQLPQARHLQPSIV